MIVVSSSQQAIDLVARVLIDPGDPVWIEEPGYLGARGALTAAGAELTPVPVDEEGLVVAAGTADEPRARLVYVTPSHQFPPGSVMSLERRTMSTLRLISDFPCPFFPHSSRGVKP